MIVFNKKDELEIEDLILRSKLSPVSWDDVKSQKKIGKSQYIILKDMFYITHTHEGTPVPNVYNKHMTVFCPNYPSRPTRREFDQICDAFGFTKDKTRKLISLLPIPNKPHIRYSILEYPNELFEKAKVMNINV